MKVALTTEGANLGCQMDARFARAEHILVVDTKTGQFETHDNFDIAQAASGAGIQAGKKVVDLGVQALVTGNMGPKAFQVLQAGGVEVFLVQGGTAQDALRSLEAGTLEQITQPNVQGHWA